MALDFQVELELTTTRQKLEHTLIMAMDVYFSRIGTTPRAQAERNENLIRGQLDEGLSDTEEGRREAMRSAFANLGKFMQEVAMYMGIVGSVRMLLADVVRTEGVGEKTAWRGVESEELKALNYQLSYRVGEKTIDYKLYYLNSGIDIDSGAVPNPLYGR